jgi:hypothetical protein
MGKLKVKGISNSMIGAYDKSPQHLLAMLERRSEKLAYLTFGAAFHTWILEPEKFEKQFVIGSARPNPNKTFAAEINAEWKEEMESNGFDVISEKDFETIKGMKESCLRQPLVRGWLEHASRQIEQDILWDKDGIPYKGRYDLKVGASVIDFKTTQDAGDNFSHSVRAFAYYRQAAMYLDGTGGDAFYIVAIEKRAPHLCRIYQISEDLIKAGQKEYLEKGPVVWNCIENDLYDEPSETKILKL